MNKFRIHFAFLFLPVCVYAAGPPGTPQMYELGHGNGDQVVMLSNWAEGRDFSEFEDYKKISPKYFHDNQDVWLWCDGITTKNTIHRISSPDRSEMATTSIKLRDDIDCLNKPALLSNHPFPKQTWAESGASNQELSGIKSKLTENNVQSATKITTGDLRTFYLIFDPDIGAIYDTGGSLLLDDKFDLISTYNHAKLKPLIDLNNDGIPEFFAPSSDGTDAWLIQLAPKLDTEISLYYKGGK